MPVVQYSIPGKTHKAKGIPCQDACSCCLSANGYHVMCVADGVSSSPHSQEASRIAVESIQTFWQDYSSAFADEDSLLSALRSSFNYAYGQIMAYRGNQYGYETTLHVAVICKNLGVFYGHVGDGGLFVWKSNGEVSCLTEAMKDVDGFSVVTLSAGPKAWHFGHLMDRNIASVLLVTDGVYDALCSSLRPKDALQYLMDPNVLAQQKLISSERSDAYFEKLFRGRTRNKDMLLSTFQSIDDDITLSVCYDL